MEELNIALGMVPDPEEGALAMLRKYQEEMGMNFENPDAPVAAMPGWESRDEEFR